VSPKVSPSGFGQKLRGQHFGGVSSILACVHFFSGHDRRVSNTVFGARPSARAAVAADSSSARVWFTSQCRTALSAPIRASRAKNNICSFSNSSYRPCTGVTLIFSVFVQFLRMSEDIVGRKSCTLAYEPAIAPPGRLFLAFDKVLALRFASSCIPQVQKNMAGCKLNGDVFVSLAVLLVKARSGATRRTDRQPLQRSPLSGQVQLDGSRQSQL